MEIIVIIIGSIFIPIILGISNYLFRIYKDSSDRKRNHDRELFEKLNSILPEKDIERICTHELAYCFLHKKSLEQLLDYLEFARSSICEFKHKKVESLHKEFLFIFAQITRFVGDEDKEQNIYNLVQEEAITDVDGNLICDCKNPQKKLIGNASYQIYLHYIESVKKKIL